MKKFYEEDLEIINLKDFNNNYKIIDINFNSIVNKINNISLFDKILIIMKTG